MATTSANNNDDCQHESAIPYAEAFDVNTPKVHRGILWCDDCMSELTDSDLPENDG